MREESLGPSYRLPPIGNPPEPSDSFFCYSQNTLTFPKVPRVLFHYVISSKSRISSSDQGAMLRVYYPQAQSTMRNFLDWLELSCILIAIIQLYWFGKNSCYPILKRWISPYVSYTSI